MSECCAILKIQSHYKKPLIEKCQQSAVATMNGVPLCGTHVKLAISENIQIITTLKRNPPK